MRALQVLIALLAASACSPSKEGEYASALTCFEKMSTFGAMTATGLETPQQRDVEPLRYREAIQSRAKALGKTDAEVLADVGLASRRGYEQANTFMKRNPSPDQIKKFIATSSDEMRSCFDRL